MVQSSKNMNVETNIAKKFLQLVSKHFPKGHKLSKVFNRNNVKASYSCMPNVASIISTHNKKVLNNNNNNNRVITPGLIAVIETSALYMETVWTKVWYIVVK